MSAVGYRATTRWSPIFANEWIQISLLLAPLGAAGAIFLGWLTPFGVGIYVDSLYYVTSARNLLAGIGMGRVTGLGIYKPMTHYPPFYSMVLALFERCGMPALDAGRVAIASASGIFPDGTPFAIPDTMSAPAPVAIKSDMAGHVALAIPIERPGAATIDPAHAEPAGARYRGVFQTVRDAIRGGAEPEELEVARLAARLILPGEDGAGYVALPIARIEGLRTDGSVAIPEGYLAPALCLSAVPWYAGLAQEVVTGLDRIAEAHGKLVLGGAGRSIENLLLLELANTARPRVAHVLAQNLHHPSELFMELAGLAGRMATYGSSSRRLSDRCSFLPRSAPASLPNGWPCPRSSSRRSS